MFRLTLFRATFRRLVSVLSLLVLAVSVLPASQDAQAAEELINLDHLRFLTEPVTIDGRDMAIVHIYSETPDYKWVDAAGEGISAVDDVARAAVVYLLQYERTKDPTLLDLARRCLEFTRYMQAADGEFYNFVYTREGEINKTGGTSYKSLTWWAFRALWAYGEGVRVFDTVDKEYADLLAADFKRTEVALSKTLKEYGRMTDLHGFSIPAWIPNGAPDQSGVAVLGLAAYQQARPNAETADVLTKITDGISQYKLGKDDRYPFGMHPVSDKAPGYWHDWGAHQVHALAVAGKLMNRKDWIASAAAEANAHFMRHLAFERFRNLGVVPDRLGQIAYGTNMIVQGYMSLYHATGEERYARYAGLATSWYFGNNMAGVQMYDPANGRVFDGIEGPAEFRVNRNSGAESTIEGLLSLLAVVDVPLAMDYIRVTPLDSARWKVLEAESAARISGEPIYYRGTWTGETEISSGRYVGLGQGQAMELTVKVDVPDDYLLYVAHMRQVKEVQQDEVAQAVETGVAPTIDGNLSEWATIPTIAANTREQILRGATFWNGPASDSHTLQLMWDAANLYVAVSVRDPEHVQTYTLSEVWHDDALWLYVIPSPNANRLSSKFTFAQTKDGPQIWDWVNSQFLEGASMQWVQEDGGYRYEAAIPWKSIGIDAAEPGMTFGLEVGRSIGGNSFMNLTGRDPDIALNLLPISLTGGSDGEAVPEVREPIFLNVSLNGQAVVPVAQSLSTDRDYFWLDPVWREPKFLAVGEHKIRFEFAGTGANDLSKVDAFLLQAAVGRRSYRLPDGRVVALVYNTLTGETTWNETTP